MRGYRADLHIHTCLSPCAELEMMPSAIVEAAARKHLDLIGICDHNAAANTPAAVRAAEGSRVAVVPGMEITTREEVHVVALFDDCEAALKMQDLVLDHLPGENDAEFFGQQVVLDEAERPIGFCPNLLIGATTLGISDVIDAIHAFGGCAIAAHVDRDRFSIISQLGFLPPHIGLDGLEYTHRIGLNAARERFGDGGRWEFVCSSDAHRLTEIGQGCCRVRGPHATASGVRAALRRQDRCRIEEDKQGS